jgi:hypothetical protein
MNPQKREQTAFEPTLALSMTRQGSQTDMIHHANDQQTKTYRKKNYADHHDEDEHETQGASARFALVFGGSRKLRRRTLGVGRD